MVCKIMVGYSHGISEHEEWFESGGWSVYIERLFGVGGFPFLLALLVLLYSKASTTLNSFDSCLVLISSIQTSSSTLNTMLHFSYQYHLHPTPPVTLKRFFYTNAPDNQCTVNIVWPLVWILFGITVKSQTVIPLFTTCVATTSRIRMCLHSLNCCKYCNQPCSVTCWGYLGPNYRWIQVCNNCVDELPRLTGFDICQYPHRSLYLNVRVRP